LKQAYHTASLKGAEMSETLRGDLVVILTKIFDASKAGELSRHKYRHPGVRELEKKGFIEGDGTIDADQTQLYRVTDAGAEYFGGFSDEAEAEETVEVEAEVVVVEQEIINVGETVAKPKRVHTKRALPAPAQMDSSPLPISAFKRVPRNTKGRGEDYPFASLPAPEGENFYSFFVPNTEEQPKPAKYLSGTVSSANKRYASEGKLFKVMAVLNDPIFNADGARVYRIK
jgi:hypothetical protein